jgi:radical SAM superfamily enzyme YgiQ (UPF0313 family)
MPLTIALVRPPVDTLHKFSKPAEALGIAHIASSLRRDGHTVVLVDAMLFDWTLDKTLDSLYDIDPDITGFTVVLNHFPDPLIKLLGRMTDGLGGIVLVGGHSVSFFPKKILKAVGRVNGVVSGEAEEAFRRIAAAVADGADWTRIPGVTARNGNGEFVSTRPERIEDIGALPWAARDLTRDVIAANGVACAATSRGCYARCTFCSVPRFYGLSQSRKNAAGAWHFRPAEDVVAEMVALKKQFGLCELLIVDDEFFGGTDVGVDRARSIARLLVDHDLGISFAISCRAENARKDVLAELQRAGLSHVFVGIESGSEQGLRLYGKRHTIEQNFQAANAIKGLGLTFQAGFMLFNPLSTLEELQRNIAFLADIGELKPTSLNSAVDPHFGAPLLAYFRQHGLLVEDDLKLTAAIPDERVRVIKLIAEMMMEAFQPFMDFIATVRASVTFEWRRSVPGRTPADETVLAAFETAVNDRFCGIVVRAIERLISGKGANLVVAQARGELTEVTSDMTVSQALVITHFNAVGRQLRPWSARDALTSAGSAA